MPQTFNKNYTFILNMGNAGIHFATDTLAVALTDIAPTTATNIYSNIASPIASSYFTGATPFNITTTSWTQTTGTAKLLLTILTLAATGAGFVPNFRYVVVYDATTNYVIGWFDYGSEVSLDGATADQFIVNFDLTNGLLQIT